jgi:DNA-binding XRE family transcriptional regulator
MTKVVHWDAKWTFDYDAWRYEIFVRRCDAGMTQKQFGETCGMSPSTISHIETGENLSLPTIIYMSSIWNIDLMKFLKR